MLPLASASTAMWIAVVLAGAFVLLVLAMAVLVFPCVPAWMLAARAGTPVSLVRLLGMRLRRVPPPLIVAAHIRMAREGLSVPLDAVEAHHLSGGNVARVAEWLAAAARAGIRLPWKRLADADLAGVLSDVVDVSRPDELAKLVGQ